MIFSIDDTYFLFNLFFVCCKCGTLLRRWPPTAPESAQRTGRSSHSRTIHPKTGEHHRGQSRQPTSGCAGPTIAGTPAQGQRAGRSAAPDSNQGRGQFHCVASSDILKNTLIAELPSLITCFAALRLLL